MQNQSLNEIESPVSRAKFEGYQEVVFDIAKEIEKLDGAIERKKGIVEACGILANRVRQECDAVMAVVDKEEMDPEEAKIRNDQTTRIVGILNEIGERNTRDLVVMEGRREGLSGSCEVIEKRFNSEKAKLERYARMDAEEDDLGRGGSEDGKKQQPEEKPAKRAKKAKK